MSYADPHSIISYHSNDSNMLIKSTLNFIATSAQWIGENHPTLGFCKLRRLLQSHFKFLKVKGGSELSNISYFSNKQKTPPFT